MSYKPRPGEIPTNPGVYRFRDADGRVLYVGKAKNLRARLSNYFAPLHTLHEQHPDLAVEGEMHGDSALDARHRLQIFPNARMREDANLLIFPTLDAANIAFNLLKNAAGEGMTVGPILLGASKPVHILTPSATVRRIINMTALTVVEDVQRD